MLAKRVAWQPPSAGSRPVPIGSRSIGVSLQPAIPRRVALQQSPLPLHQSVRILAQSQSAQAIKCAAQLPQGCRPAFGCGARARRVRRQPECHLYFARRVSFLSCADSGSPEENGDVVSSLRGPRAGLSPVRKSGSHRTRRWRKTDSNYWSRHGETPLGRAMWFPRRAPPARRGADPERDESYLGSVPS